MNHVGLVKECGESISAFVGSYRDIHNLVHLISAMQEVRLSAEDIKF